MELCNASLGAYVTAEPSPTAISLSQSFPLGRKCHPRCNGCCFLQGWVGEWVDGWMDAWIDGWRAALGGGFEAAGG